jgi:hypothetical protein
MADISGGPSPHARFVGIAERFRARPVPTPRPGQPESTPAQQLASALQPWCSQSQYSLFLHYLCERITMSHEATRRALHEGAIAEAAYAGGYEAALDDLHAAFIAWREGQPHDGPQRPRSED